MAEIDAQRADTLRALRAEGERGLSQLRETSLAAVDAAGERAERVVDRVAMRIAQLALGFAALALLAGLLVARAVGHRLRSGRAARPA
jgi:hypothetical protein